MATRALAATAIIVLMAGLALPAQSPSGLDMRDSTPAFLPPRAAPPPGSPNVVVILLDDLGYADLGAYGSEISTPGIDRHADAGLREQPLLPRRPSATPSLAALLTSLNHHSAGVGWLAGTDCGYPGYRGQLARDAVTLAEVLQQAGFASLMVGKWHLAAARDASAAGPFHNWPTSRGFDRYWGFLGGVVSQFFPDDLVDGTEVISPPADGSFYLPDWLTDRAIGMIRDLRATNTEQAVLPRTTRPGPPTRPITRCRKTGPRMRASTTTVGTRYGTRAWRGRSRWDWCPGKHGSPSYNPGVVPWADLDADQRRMFAQLQENYVRCPGQDRPERGPAGRLPAIDRRVREHHLRGDLGQRRQPADRCRRRYERGRPLLSGRDRDHRGEPAGLRHRRRLADLPHLPARLDAVQQHVVHPGQALDLRRWRRTCRSS